MQSAPFEVTLSWIKVNKWGLQGANCLLTILKCDVASSEDRAYLMGASNSSKSCRLAGIWHAGGALQVSILLWFLFLFHKHLYKFLQETYHSKPYEAMSLTSRLCIYSSCMKSMPGKHSMHTFYLILQRKQD